MDEELIAKLSGRHSRRGLIKGVALAGVGAAGGSALMGGIPVLAGEPPEASGHGATEIAQNERISTRSSPAFQSIWGPSFKPLLSTTSYSFTGNGLYWAGAGGREFIYGLTLPEGAIITAATFYVYNTDASTSLCRLLRLALDTGMFAGPYFDAAPTPSTAAIQAVNLAIPAAGVVVSNKTYTYYLSWFPATGSTEESLVGVKLAYALEPGLAFLSTPIRVLDTRPGAIAGITPGARLAAGSTFDLQVTGTMVGGISVPAGARGVFGNVTVTNEAGPGLLKLFPAGAALPVVSTINYAPGVNVANAVLVGLNSDGKFSIYTDTSATDVIFDAAGYIV